MYRVFDNDMPADRYNFVKLTDDKWANSKFKSFEEALAYVKIWLGHYATPLDLDNWNGSKFDYSGYGDTIEIRRIGL